MNHWNEADTQLLEVPLQWAPEVRRYASYLSSLPPSEELSHSARAPEAPGVEIESWPDYELWSDEEVIALANAGTTTATNYRRIMNEIIDHQRGGDWVSIGELSEWTKISYKKVANFRTQIYRYLHAHTEHETAPFTGTWGTNINKNTKFVLYRVSEECAAQWSRVQPALDA